MQSMKNRAGPYGYNEESSCSSNYESTLELLVGVEESFQTHRERK
jgi:hypothetical protein